VSSNRPSGALCWVPGWTLLFIAVLFLGGVQLLALGVIGEYLGRVYWEVKRRPLRRYGGRHIVYLSKYLPEDDALYRMDDMAVVDFTLGHLARMFPDLRPDWVRAAHVWRALLAAHRRARLRRAHPRAGHAHRRAQARHDGADLSRGPRHQLRDPRRPRGVLPPVLLLQPARQRTRGLGQAREQNDDPLRSAVGRNFNRAGGCVHARRHHIVGRAVMGEDAAVQPPALGDPRGDSLLVLLAAAQTQRLFRARKVNSTAGRAHINHQRKITLAR
jgi:hypothetical protein